MTGIKAVKVLWDKGKYARKRYGRYVMSTFRSVFLYEMTVVILIVSAYKGYSSKA